MTTKQLLSSNSYIQYPKFLGFYIGVNEAILLSALCDKDSWCEFNVTNYDGWFYYLRDEIYIETGLSERQQRTALSTLEDMRIVSLKRQGIPAKVYYFIHIEELENALITAYDAYKLHKSQMLQNVTSCPDKTVTTCTSENVISTIDKNINKKNIKQEAPEPAPSPVNTRRKFREKHEHLTDELSSGEVIDNEKKERKKKSNYEKCLDEISSRNFSDEVKELLQKHLDWSYNSRDPKRIKDRVSYKPKLNMLEQLAKKGEDIKKVVQQSIDRQWHAFYEYKGNTIVNKHEPLADRVVTNNPEESHKILMERLADPNAEVY